MMYVKIFRQTLDSSIANDWMTRHVFMDLLLLADRNGIVDMTPESIARVTNGDLQSITAAIAKLEAPDSTSRDPAHEGRRILRLDSARAWGWEIVNYEKYRDTKTEEHRLQYLRDYMRRRRKTQRQDRVQNDAPTTDAAASGIPALRAVNGKKQKPVDTARDES